MPLPINSNLGLISHHHVRNKASYSLKLSIDNCSQTTADGDVVTTDSLQEASTVQSDGTITNPLQLTI